jgi:hypothetical protein
MVLQIVGRLLNALLRIGVVIFSNPEVIQTGDRYREVRDIVRMFFILLRRVPSPDWSFLFRGTRLDSGRGGLS